MMGYASHLVAEVATKNLDSATSDTAMAALGLYYAQLALNFAWMPLFFSGEWWSEPEASGAAVCGEGEGKWERQAGASGGGAGVRVDG